MANERLWDSIGPVAFTANGGQDGVVTLTSTQGLRVKQQVKIYSASQQPPQTQLEIKKVLSLTKAIIGPIVSKGEFMARYNLSAYLLSDSASLTVIEQKKSKPAPEDIVKAVYEQEPVVAIRTIGIDELGNPWSDTNPVPVEGTIVTTSNDPTIQRVQNIALTIANQEYTIDLPDGTKRYYLRIRGDMAKGRLAFIPTETATEYTEMTRGNSIDSHFMDLPINSKLYFSADKANMILEVVTWIRV